MTKLSRWKILAPFIVAAIIVWALVASRGTAGKLEINFLDVGQGDSILVTTPKKQTFLIDGGPDNTILDKLGDHLNPFTKRIDIIVLTHPHADHVTGLIEIFKRYNVGIVVLNGAFLATDNYSQFIEAVQKSNVKVLVAETGEAIHFDGDLEFDIVYSPDDSVAFSQNSEGFGSNGDDVNETSIVGKLIFKNFSALFTGDATSKIENRISLYGVALKSDILKISHHGSRYSSFPSFLKTVSPKAAVIEVGEGNFYNLPSPATLSRLEALKIKIFRTDKNGDVKVISDGYAADIFTER